MPVTYRSVSCLPLRLIAYRDVLLQGIGRPLELFFQRTQQVVPVTYRYVLLPTVTGHRAAAGAPLPARAASGAVLPSSTAAPLVTSHCLPLHIVTGAVLPSSTAAPVPPPDLGPVRDLLRTHYQ